MLRDILAPIRTAFLLLVLMSVLTGIIYPFFITGITQVLFHHAVNGSLLPNQQGSELIGQTFTNPRYFWGRPSSTTPVPNNAMASMGSNLGPTNPALMAAVETRVAALHQADPTNQQLIPADLVTASGSGLDPDISPLAAFYQVHRVAHVRGLPEAVVKKLVLQHVQHRTFFILGEPRINVLELNLALDALPQHLLKQ